MQITASDGKIPEKIMVLPVGDWNTQFYGPMQVTQDHLSQIVANFKAGVRKAVPVDVDHDGGRAAGWIKDLDAGSDGLHAQVEWTPYGETLLKNKEYKLFSPEWSFDYVDPEHGSRHGCVLIAGSLTNRPLFKELPVLMANDGSSKEKGLTNEKSIMILLGSDRKLSANDMNIKDILAKPVADRTPEEVAFVREHISELSEEEKTSFETDHPVEKSQEEKDAEAKAEAEKAEAEAKAKAEQEEKEKAEKEAAEKAEAERKANEGKTVTITAAEHAELLKAKEEAVKAKEELRRSATEKELKGFMANDKGGKILPKAFEDGSLVNMVLSFSEAQKKSFIAFVQSMPEIKVAGEKGADDAKPLTAKEQVDSLVLEKVKASEGKLSKAQAIKDVLAENEALAKQYQEELQSK